MHLPRSIQDFSCCVIPFAFTQPSRAWTPCPRWCWPASTTAALHRSNPMSSALSLKPSRAWTPCPRWCWPASTTAACCSPTTATRCASSSQVRYSLLAALCCAVLLRTILCIIRGPAPCHPVLRCMPQHCAGGTHGAHAQHVRMPAVHPHPTVTPPCQLQAILVGAASSGSPGLSCRQVGRSGYMHLTC